MALSAWTRRAVCAALVALVALAGCAIDDRSRLQGEIDALLPDGARKSGECDWASGFVEDAPASLNCRYLVDGRVESVATQLRAALRKRRYSVELKPLPPEAPTRWAAHGERRDYWAGVALVAPGELLAWQLGRTPVEPGEVGILISVAERE